jgi:hypothetical protein
MGRLIMASVEAYAKLMTNLEIEDLAKRVEQLEKKS